MWGDNQPWTITLKNPKLHAFIHSPLFVFLPLVCVLSIFALLFFCRLDLANPGQAGATLEWLNMPKLFVEGCSAITRVGLVQR